MDIHSRVVAILKVLFPLMALVILSVLFLLSRSADFTARIRTSDESDGLAPRTERIVVPMHTTVTEGGDQILIRAESGSANASLDDGQYKIDQALARIIFAEGGTASVTADRIESTDRQRVLRLSGNVSLKSSLGYALEASEVETAVDRVEIESRGAIKGATPFGALTAGEFRIGTSEGDGDVRMLFTDGVRLVYEPDPNFARRP